MYGFPHIHGQSWGASKAASTFQTMTHLRMFGTQIGRIAVLRRPDGLQVKYPDFCHYYRRAQCVPSDVNALASKPTKDVNNESPSSHSHHGIDGDRCKANAPDDGEKHPY